MSKQIEEKGKVAGLEALKSLKYLISAKIFYPGFILVFLFAFSFSPQKDKVINLSYDTFNDTTSHYTSLIYCPGKNRMPDKETIILFNDNGATTNGLQEIYATQHLYCDFNYLENKQPDGIKLISPKTGELYKFITFKAHQKYNFQKIKINGNSIENETTKFGNSLSSFSLHILRVKLNALGWLFRTLIIIFIAANIRKGKIREIVESFVA